MFLEKILGYATIPQLRVKNMDVIKRPSEQKTMAYALRPLDYRDIPQVAEIEREAFPEMWPPTSFRRELKNRLARYLVAYERVDDRPSEPTPALNNPDHQ